MLKDVAAAAGGAVLLTPLGIPFVLHGVAGMLVGGAGLYIADSVLKQILADLDSLPRNPEEQEKSDAGHDLTPPSGGAAR